MPNHLVQLALKVALYLPFLGDPSEMAFFTIAACPSAIYDCRSYWGKARFWQHLRKLIERLSSLTAPIFIWKKCFHSGLQFYNCTYHIDARADLSNRREAVWILASQHKLSVKVELSVHEWSRNARLFKWDVTEINVLKSVHCTLCQIVLRIFFWWILPARWWHQGYF